MIAWFTRNAVAANLLMVSIIFFGFLSLQTRIPLEVFPNLRSDTIQVIVSLRGATPEEVEESVSVRIEEAVQDLEGIEEIRSRSMEGRSSVSIELESGYDERELLNDIKSRVDAINTFPTEAERPVIRLASMIREVITVSVAGLLSEKEIRQQAERVRDDLLQIPGITQIELEDARDYEIAIDVSRDQLRQYNLQLSDVVQAIRRSSLDLSAGNIKSESGEVRIRLKGQAYDRPEFERVVVATQPDGSIVRIGDLASVKDGFSEDPIAARFNGRPAAMVEVYRVGDQSAIDVANKVKQYVAERQDSLPDGLELSTWRDSSVFVKARLNTLIKNAAQGGILVMALLSLFLRPSVGLWVFAGIPVAFMGAFSLMPLLGITINLISLFGFILVLGLVVDDAIVTGENVYRHLQTSESGEMAAIRGTEEVAAPVTFGILTTIAAFLPMTMIDGPRGVMFLQMAGVIIPILLFSLVESKLVLPAHLKHLKPKTGERSGFDRWQQSFADGFENFILRYYKPALAQCLRHRHLTLASFIGVFIVVGAMVFSGWMRFVFFPNIPSETITMTLVMPTGTSFEVTDQHIERATQAAIQLQNEHFDEASQTSVVRQIYSSTGRGAGQRGTHVGLVRLEMIPPEGRNNKITNRELVAQWREKIGDIPGADELLFRSTLGHTSDPIDIQLAGNNIAELRQAADLLKQELATHQGVFDINDTMAEGQEELRLVLKPQAYALGLTQADVIRQVREAFWGFEAQRIQRGRDDVRVMVRYPRDERSSIANLEDFRIRTASGSVPVGQVAELVPGKSPTIIYRNNLKRTLDVTADVDKDVVNMAVVNASIAQFLDATLIAFPSVSYSFEGEAREQADSFRSLAYGLMFVLFAIYCLLAIPFKSYGQPLLVMSIIPFGTIGAIFGHWFMGMPLTLFSVLGMLALVGVVVNDSLVLVDFINKQRREKQKTVYEAIQAAGVARFRPVMLTSLTTFFGLLPLLFETSTQAQFLIPMATSLGFGIIFATFITLLLIPINYLIAWELKQLVLGRSPYPADTASV